MPGDHEGGEIGGVDGEQDEGEGGPELKSDITVASVVHFCSALTVTVVLQ